jgi:T1SS-143 domain-containing protein
MANKVILPEVDQKSFVEHTLKGGTTELSIRAGDVQNYELDGKGGLILTLKEGGQVHLNQFESFISKGNQLLLNDGTKVDPNLIFNALIKQNTDPMASDAIKIDAPSGKDVKEVSLESGKKYLLNFDIAETKDATVEGNKMVIEFKDGGKLVITNYGEATSGETPAALSLVSKDCIVSGDDLITNIQELAQTTEEEKVTVIEDSAVQPIKVAEAPVEQEEKTAKAEKTEEQKAAQVETAAGEEADIAKQLAEIETAAGGAGARNSGYGFNSRPTIDPFLTNPDIGPINPTALNYRAPLLEPGQFIDEEVPNDDNPIAIRGDAKFLDETNLSGGPISVSGSISVDYGADGPGGVSPNGSFASSGSKLNGALTHNGEPVIVSIEGNNYVGKTAGGETVFTLAVNPANGDYTFTQFLPLDHANGTDPNDQISLEFGLRAQDGDGDSVNTTVQIIIADDAPSASGATETIDETNLGPIVETGAITVNFGQDGPGRVETTNSFAASGSVAGGALSSSGVPVTVTSTATGYVGTAGGVTVFTLTINPANGQYTYTQFKNLDHADNSDPNDIITLTFGTKVIDFDGDSANAPIVINIKDDAPIFQPPEEPPCGCDPEHPVPGNPKPDQGLEIVDETNLNLGPVVETGKLNADFGADVPGSYAFINNSFAASGSLKNGILTHEGVPVVVTLQNGIYVGKAGDVTVFTLELNGATGDYKFTLFDNFDHADGSNPNDAITLDFGVKAADYEGDSANGSIRIVVKDDAPVANDDVNTYDTTFGVANGNVITGLNGGPGAADNLSTDAPNKVVKIAFGGNEVDVPETGTVSIDGQYGKLTIAADGTYTYEAFEHGGMIETGHKEFVSGPALPDFDESEALDGVEQQSLGVAPGNLEVDAGNTVNVTFVSEGAGYGNTFGIFTVDADGNLKAETVLIKNGNEAVPGQSFSYTTGSGAESVGFFIVANGEPVNYWYQNVDFSTGSIDFIYNYGQPDARGAKATDDGSHISLVYTSAGGEKTVLEGPLYFSTDRGGSEDLNADGSVRVVSGIPGDDNTVLRIGFEDLPKNISDEDYNDIVFDVKIDGKQCGCHDENIKDEFVYTIKDGDGDTDKATLTLNGKDLTDDKPILTKPADEVVDETNLKDGTVTETGSIGVNFGHDGPGTVAGNGSFTSGGSQKGGILSHNGVPVAVTLVGDTYVGKAGNVTVFTMQIKNDGSYTFKLFENLDHADGNNPNDVIDLNFGVKATDCDGDKSATHVTVKVKDDAPIANDDFRNVDEQTTITGNVTSNDVDGQDDPATVTKVVFNGTEFTVPSNGDNVTIEGDKGTLVINKDGEYTYTSKKNADGVDKFTYTLTDRDGDKDTADLCITVTDKDTTPEIIKPEKEIVDETNLKDGVITETGTVTADFKDDGPGTFAANGAFTSGGSKLNGALTHQGVPVVVSLNGNTYEGKAGDVTVFTLAIAANGSYTFKLFEQLDHADGNNPNDIIDLNFGVKATDEDGDSASTTITVHVKDDAPDAKDDNATVEEGGTATGNVTSNDVPGQDTPATVTKVSYNGTTFDVPTSGDLTINGANGTLKINQSGQYTYTAKNNADGTDSFLYTLRDRDGDTDTACLNVCVKDGDTTPEIIKPEKEVVDETNLKDGTITETGSISADFKDDGPGTFAANGSFTSGGSRLGGVLSHNGTPVTVTLNGNTYEGKAGGVTVFTLAIAADGSYTFKLFEQLDHADGSNPNDIIDLNFGVKAVDSDGDEVSTTITVHVKDDAPDAKDDTTNVDEGGTATGNVTSNDVPGQDTPATVTKVSYNGTTFDVPTSGDLTINAANGTLKINQSGVYTYTAKNNADGVDNFIYTLRDRDGDTDTACLSVCVKDNDTTPEIIKPAKETVDETNLKDGVITETGTVTADFKDDGPGTFAANGSFTSSGSKLNGALTHNGIPVVVSLNGNTYEGKAGGVTVFTLAIAADGSYTFKLLEQLDHADGSNPDDIITLDFGVKATDTDGDSAATTITVCVKDDAPDAKNDVNTFDSNAGMTNGNVVTGLNGGAGAADTLSQDTPNKVAKIAFGSTEVDVPASGTVSIDGAHGKLTIAADGSYTYTLFDSHNNDGGKKTFVDGPNLPDFDESEALDSTEQQSLGVAKGNLDVHAGDKIDVTFVKEIAGYSNTLGVFTVTADGKLVAETILIKNSDTVAAGQSFSYTAGADAQKVGFFLVADGANENSNYGGIDLTKGSLNFVYNYGQAGQRDAMMTDDGSKISLIYTSETGVKTVIDGPLYFTTERGVSENLNADDSIRVVSDVPGSDNTVLRIGFEDLPQLGDKDYNDMIFDVSITDKDCGCHDDTQDVFKYTLQDNDGDKDQATLTLNGKDMIDDNPTLTGAVETVDETDLILGAIVETGNVAANYFRDGPGSIAATGSFSSSGSRANNALSFNGTPINVSLEGNTYVGKAGNVTVFTLAIATSGAYTFTLLKPLDHADPTNPDDIIDLNFGIRATDCDGDQAHNNIVIHVKDDAPDSTPVIIRPATEIVDETNLKSGTITETGTVTADFKEDGPGSFAATGSFTSGGSRTGGVLSHNGTPVTVTLEGNTYVGKAGSITVFTMAIASNGSYTFKLFEQLDHADGSNPNDIIDLNFGVKATDTDGDSDTTSITVQVKDDAPDARDDGTFQLDAGQSRTGNVLTNDIVGQDTPGRVTKVAYNGTTYDIAAGGSVTITGAEGVLTIHSNGNYTYDHTHAGFSVSGHRWNDLSDSFTYTLQDKDGDTDTAKLSFNVSEPYTPPPSGDGSTGDGSGGGPGDGCPLVFDMNGDGLHLIAKENGVSFDIDEDGVADRTAWVGADDAILVLDKNGDGVINDHSEMFGNDEIGGFEMLADYDSNHDGLINAQDAAWDELKLWQDKNGDAVSTADELFSLDEKGFENISLTVEEYNQIIAGNDVTVKGKATMTDGSTLAGYDAWFKYDSGKGDFYGHAGEDRFVLDAEAKTVHGFNACEGDKLDLSMLLEGQDNVTEAINDFVYARSENGSTIIAIDLDGSGTQNQMQDIVKIDGQSDLDIAKLVQDGNLIV